MKRRRSRIGALMRKRGREYAARLKLERERRDKLAAVRFAGLLRRLVSPNLLGERMQ